MKKGDIIELRTKTCGTFPGLIVARISLASGEIEYSVAVTKYGGLWIKGNWVTDKYWNSISEKALEQNYPGTMARIIDKLPAIKEWQTHTKPETGGKNDSTT